MENTYIYFLKDPRTGDVFYIGKSNAPKRRLSQHMQDENTNRQKARVIKSILQAGEHVILEVVEHVEYSQWGIREMFWIAYGREQGWPLTNIEPGGERLPNKDVSISQMKRYLSPVLLGRFLAFPATTQNLIMRLTCLHMIEFGYLATKIKHGVKFLDNWDEVQVGVEGIKITQTLVTAYGTNLFNELSGYISLKSNELNQAMDIYLLNTWNIANT